MTTVPPPASGIDESEMAWGREIADAIDAIKARISAKMATVTADNAGRLLEAERYSANVLFHLEQAVPDVGTLALVLAQGGKR